MQAVTITTGTGFDRFGSTIDAAARDAALASIRAYLARTFGGYTETATVGGWINPAGELVVEPGATFTVYTDADRETINRAAHYARAALAQHSVVLALAPANVAFMEAPALETETVGD